MSGRPEFQNPQNWHSRGYLPHYDAGGKCQMITYRLADSLPQELLKNGSAGFQPAYKDLSLQEKVEHCKKIETLLDTGYGSCILKKPPIAQKVVNAWKFFDGERYDLIAYVVMPNHVHVLINTYKEFTLKSVVHSWKSFTSNEIKKCLSAGSAGFQPANDRVVENNEEDAGKMPSLLNKVWQEDYWDRFIRDENHFKSSVNYILENPVKAGLVESWQEWPWSFNAYMEGVS